MKTIELFGIRLPIVQTGDSLVDLFLKTIEEEPNFQLENEDVIVVASKAISASEGRTRLLNSIQPSNKALELALSSDLEPEFVEIVLEEAEEIVGSVPGAILTLREGIVQANAGIDKSNTPKGTAILLPASPENSAVNFQKKIEKMTGKKIAVIVSDSRTTPLRRGTSGVALGVAGLIPVIDDRGKLDLYGNQIRITWRAVADNCCCSAQLLMGESNEQTPVVIIRGLSFDKEGTDSMQISPEECLYFGTISDFKSAIQKR